MTPLLFSTFEVTTQAFYRASLSSAIVNLKPIVPGRKNFLNHKLEELTDCMQMFSFFQIELFHYSPILMVLFDVRCYDIPLVEHDS